MAYIPGICNITPGGRRKRLAAGIAFVAISMASYAYAPSLLSIPVFIACILLIEYRQGFCVHKGLRGLHEDDKGSHHTNMRFVAVDRKKSYKIILAAAIVSSLILLI